MSEPYQVRITARAARDLQRLPEKIATACVELAGLRAARRGDFRVVYAIVEDTG